MLKLATFHTTTGAMQFEKFLKTFNHEHTLKPVPRSLSASCGISIEFSATLDDLNAIKDLDKIYSIKDTEYIQIFPFIQSVKL